MKEPSSNTTKVMPESFDDEAQIRAFRLVVISGPDEGAEYESSSERTVIGKHESADFVLTDATVSRFHCELSVDESGVQLRDLDSRNGTKIGGALIAEARLVGPVVLAVGGTELRFEEISSSVRISLSTNERMGAMIGGSRPMRALFSLLSRASSSSANVLIEGEPGAGKGAAAATIHECSQRSEGPFGVVSCSAPAKVVEHDLFGGGDEPGALELCSGGTLVLEDVGALTEALQARLQRALEEHAVRRNDGGKLHGFDTRIVATSRRNLRRDVNLRRFRTPLFTRIAALRLRVPPLRERLFDIPLLIAAFLDEAGAADSPAAAGLLTGGSIESLRAHSWPGNVRELRAYVERCVSLDRVVAPSSAESDAMPVIDPSVPLRQARDEWLAYFQRRYLADALERSGGNVSAAARMIGIDRVHMHRLLKSAGLR